MLMLVECWRWIDQCRAQAPMEKKSANALSHGSQGDRVVLSLIKLPGGIGSIPEAVNQIVPPTRTLCMQLLANSGGNSGG